MKPQTAFSLARDYRGPNDKRAYHLVAVGLRSDGAIVKSRNGAAQDRAPTAHAESRLSRKLDMRAVVYVARFDATGNYRLARPCKSCMARLRNAKVRRVYYTISDNEYGVIDL